MAFLQEQNGHDSGPINYYKEAFLVPHNCLALAGAAALSVMALSLYPLLAMLGLELMYLSAIPSNPRFQRWARSRRAQARRRQEQLDLASALDHLPGAVRRRYLELERMCGAIRINYRHLSSTSQALLDHIQRRLETLLETYLRLLSSAHQHSEYLEGAGPREIRRQIERLERSPRPDSAKVQEMNESRMAILHERLAKSQKIIENKQVVDAQCAAIEDLIRLMREQSFTWRDPQNLSDQLDALLEDARHAEEAVTEIESFLATERQAVQ